VNGKCHDEVKLMPYFYDFVFLLRLISNKFYCPIIGTTDERVVSLMIHR
jgi:hypothetical protein